MSRIERYQQSIEKFINNKNILQENIKNNLLKLDHLSGIILSSIISNNIKKNNFKVHGYYMSIAIDLLYYIIEIQNIKNQDNNNILNLFNTVYQLFQLNIESLKISSKQETNYNKIISFMFSYLNSKLFTIIKQYEFSKLKKLPKNDVININFITDDLKNKLKNIMQISNEDLMNYINNTYGNIGSLVFIIGWTLGGGELKPELLKDLQTIGENYGILYKICIDFENIVKDINLNSRYCVNLVINLGIQETFTLFMTTKTKIIELCLKNNMYSHTIKEVIDLLETKIDKCLKNAEIDMNSTYSTYSTYSSISK
jgi:hypothetical protein